MKVFQQTGPRHMNLILHRQVFLCGIYQKRKIYSLREVTFKALQITELITLMA
jgi:hypothetical protein